MALRDALLQREELVGTEITAVLEAAAQKTPVVIDLRDVPEAAESAEQFADSRWVQASLDV
jgi:hypothetical protein